MSRMIPYRLRLFWYRTDKEALSFVAVLAVLVAAFGFVLQAVFAHKDDRLSLLCLARNVYFEARGEPEAGQYAVAEVTMNRAASPLYPATVCEVVYQKSAFSWTGLAELPPPGGEEWKRARKVAEAVYYGRQAPALEGALFYHATRIEPGWASGKERVARIGRHVFYK